MAERVVITGASAGLGRAVARLFARRGWRVALLARGEDGLAGAARDVAELGGMPLAIPADVADPQAMHDAADRVAREWGGIDVWINNAMATVMGPIEEVTPDEFRRVTDVTYHGVVWGTQAALRHMRRQGRGTIVQVGSALAYRSIPLQAPYCAAKAAARAFTDSLRSELIHEGSPVRLTMVHMPGMNTPQFEWSRLKLDRVPQPVPPVFDPAAAAEAVVRAALEAPRELWVGGSTTQAILGQMVLPGFLDRLLSRKAWEGQMTGRRPIGRRDNLFAPVPGDHGARGPYVPQSSRSLSVFDPATVRALGIAAGGVAVLGALAGALAAARR